MPKLRNLPVTTRELISDVKAREFLLPSSSWGSHHYRRSGYREEPQVLDYIAYIGTNHKPTHNPLKESDQSDVPLPRNSFFLNTSYISNVIQNPGLLLIATASVSVGAPARAGNKNSLAFASDIGSLVVIGRFCDLGVT